MNLKVPIHLDSLRLNPDVLGEMWQPDERFLSYYHWLERQLEGSSRLEHSLGVCETSIQLASTFGFSKNEIQKAAIAGLLHDSAKLMTLSVLLETAKNNGLELEEWDIASPKTLHSFIGAELVKNELGIHDSDILNAIRYHTTGRSGMSNLEKIVFVADKTESRTRKLDYRQWVCRDLDPKQLKSLDKTVLNILDETLRYLIDKKLAIHPRTIEARNDIVMSLKSSIEGDHD